MKLRHVIAGTVALPLALAVASANAAVVAETDKGTLKVGGYISGILTETMYDQSKAGNANDVNNGIGLGLSRLNFTYTNDKGVTLFYENDWASTHTSATDKDGKTKANEAGYRLRHAAVMYDGFVAGHTWSGFANLNGLGETIDGLGTANTATWANRTAVLGKNFDLGDGMSVGVFLEDQTVGSKPKTRTKQTALPDITANFKGAFGDLSVFAGVRMNQVDDGDDTEGKVDFAASASFKVSDELTIKGSVTSYDEGVERSPNGRDNAISVAVGFKANSQLRFNAIAEQFLADANNQDYTSIWVNGFYTLDSGLEFGGELQMVSADKGSKSAGGLDDGDMVVRIQAKYAF